MSFDWELARTFLAVADAGSLSAAARALGHTQPTVSRQMIALEASRAVTLFERTGRSVALTPAGVELIEHIRAMAAGADMVRLVASEQSQSVEGLVRVTAAEFMAAFVLPPLVATLRERAPELEIEIVADNGLRDLTRREADIAIRHVRPEQPSLIMKGARDDVMRAYVSPAYLAAHGTPTRATLSAHQIISYVDPDRMPGYLNAAGLDVGRQNVCLSTSSQLVALEMAGKASA